MRLLPRWTAIATVGALVLLAIAAPSLARPAYALSGSDFRADNIISDQDFFNTNTMSQASIQTFLESKEQGCTAAYGYPCLKDYTESTSSRALSAGRCNGYDGAAKESASQIIFKVSRSCGINPQVLLALLEKEQGLVSSKAPTSWKYQAATGYGCPDTAACNSQYYGFYNQVYRAAWQFKEYVVDPAYWRYHVGNVSVQYSPNAACGSSVVNIQNAATAALYNYTPYQPNSAALNNLYGTGDSCSAYGNRNFWVYFNTWFTSAPAMIAQAWIAQGGASGPLGAPTSGLLTVSANGGGLGQAFVGGSIYWSPVGGVRVVSGAIRAYWFGLSGETGSFGWPTSDVIAESGGLGQAFEHGSVYSSVAGGTHGVSGVVRDAYFRLQGERGVLGWPVGEQTAVSGGVMQVFQNGTIYASGGRSRAVLDGAIADAWLAAGGVSGSLGWPTSDPITGTANGGGVGQAFQDGSIYWSAPRGAFAVTGPIRDFYFSRGGETGALGWPAGAAVCGLADGGCSQAFQGGTITWSPNQGGKISR